MIKLAAFGMNFGRIFSRFGPRTIWAVSASAANFTIISTIARADRVAEVSFPLAPLYVAYLYFDAVFATANEIDGPKQLSLRPTFIFFTLMTGMAIYFALARTNVQLHGVPFLLSLIAICGIARASFSASVQKLLYQKASARLFAIQIALVSALTSLFLLAMFASAEVARVLVFLQFLTVGVVSAISGWGMRLNKMRSTDFRILLLVLADQVKNQIVFIIFAHQVPPHDLAHYLFLRTLLAPAVLFISVRRKTMEDEAITNNERLNLFSSGTLLTYGALLSLLPASLSLFKLDFGQLLIWSAIIVIQDWRALFVRMGIFFHSIPKSGPAISSIVATMVSVVILLQLKNFSLNMLMIPVVVDVVILVLMRRVFINFTRS